MAVIESYTIDASRLHLLDGPYSRFQWHHPGPIYFYGMVPFYAASGGRTAGLAAAAVIFNVAAIAALAAIAATSGGAASGVFAAAAMTLYVLRVPDLLTSAWNPHVAVLPMALALVASAAAAAGRRWMLPVAALSLSLAVQTHVGTAPAAAAIALVTLIVLLAERGFTRLVRAPLIASCIVALVAWLPSIIEQFTRTPGNMTALWSFFVHTRGPGQPFHTAFLAWAGMLTAVFRPGFHLAHGSTLRPARGAIVQGLAIGQVVLLFVIASIASRRRARFAAWSSWLLLAATLAALWSATRIEGEIMDHEIFWVSALGALNAGAIAACATDLLGARLSNLRTAAFAATAALVMACGTVGLVEMREVRANSFAPTPDRAGVERAAAGVREYLQRNGINRPFVDIDQGSWALAAGVLLQLKKAGLRYSVDDSWLPMFTDAARSDGGESLALSIADRARHVTIAGAPGVTPVVESDPVFVDAYRFSSKR
jgi:hypothetical protein